jgi:hypothetical protein
LWFLTHDTFVCSAFYAGILLLAIAMPTQDANLYLIGVIVAFLPLWSAQKLDGTPVLFPAHWHEVPIPDIRHIDNTAVQQHLTTVQARLQSAFGDHFAIVERRLVQNETILDPTVWIVDKRTKERACIAIYDNDIGYLRLS